MTSLENVPRRCSWLKRLLFGYDRDLSKIFPASWRVSEKISLKFCDDLRADLVPILAKHEGRFDVKALLKVLQKVIDFEVFLAKRFRSVRLCSLCLCEFELKTNVGIHGRRVGELGVIRKL